MRALVISGGTGSIGLKRELSKFVDRKNLKTLINCYDNGLSTGLVRKVFNGEILGPSDARKQQFLDYELYRDKVECTSSEFVYETLNKRITVHKNPEWFIKNEVKNLPDAIIEAVGAFFEMPLSHQIKYIDFSLANIVYGGLAHNEGSLQKAVDIMAEILNLPKNIIINDDTSLFLCANTENCTEIYDESEIVDWCNADNKITDVFFRDVKGDKKTPVLTKRAKDSIESSDLIICSPGTQFSSLIPTYKSEGFLESIKNKKVYLIKNAFQDKDMIGYTDEEELNKIFEYLPLKNICTIFTHTTIEGIEEADMRIGDFLTNNKHNNVLVQSILEKYYEYNKETNLIFDYDDTIFSRNENEVDISLENIELISNLTNNTYLFTGKKMAEIDDNLKMQKFFTCYGSSVYSNERKPINNYSVLSPEKISSIIDILRIVGFNFSKIENRDNSIISLRFLEHDYREVLYNFLKIKLPNLKILKAGKQTIDIMEKGNDKLINFEKAFKSCEDIFYIGDEINGNDKDIMQKLNSLHVKDVLCTNTFLKYVTHLNKGTE